jgi:hypothetical protein
MGLYVCVRSDTLTLMRVLKNACEMWRETGEIRSGIFSQFWKIVGKWSGVVPSHFDLKLNQRPCSLLLTNDMYAKKFYTYTVSSTELRKTSLYFSLVNFCFSDATENSASGKGGKGACFSLYRKFRNYMCEDECWSFFYVFLKTNAFFRFSNKFQCSHNLVNGNATDLDSNLGDRIRILALKIAKIKAFKCKLVLSIKSHACILTFSENFVSSTVVKN